MNSESSPDEYSASPDLSQDNGDLAFDWQQKTGTHFQDVGGYNDKIETLWEAVIDPDQTRHNGYQRFGIDPVQGILFHGPPGTGKTMFARALATTLDRPYVELNQAQLTSQWINESPQLVHRLFEEANRLNGIVFIDEAEQLLGRRDDSKNAHNEDKKLTNTFLTQLADEEKSFIVVLTTNRKDMMDPAILRPGRIDLHMEIGPPGLEARHKIISNKLEDVPQSVSEDLVDEIAETTDGWTGADLEGMTNQAKRDAARENARCLTDEHLHSAFEEIAKSKRQES